MRAMTRPLVLGLVLVGVTGAVILSRRKKEEDGEPLGGLGDPEVHVRGDGVQASMSYVAERARARAIMAKAPPGKRFDGTGSYAVLPVTRRAAKAYLTGSYGQALKWAAQNASGFVPYAVVQVTSMVDWRVCQDRGDVGCGPSQVVAYVDTNGQVTQGEAASMPDVWTMKMCAGGDRMVPELGY
jgi:hypothetical protein